VPSCLRLPSRGSQITFDIGIGARIEDHRTDLILTNDGDLPSLRMIWRNNLPTLTALLHDRTWIFYSEPLPAARNLLILLRRVWNLALT
jgi:hypothetical protein